MAKLPDTEDDFFAFEKEYDGVHPYKEGDRVIADFGDHVRYATVRRVYWHMGYSTVDLRFDDDNEPGVYRWGAKRVMPLNAVDRLGELA